MSNLTLVWHIRRTVALAITQLSRRELRHFTSMLTRLTPNDIISELFLVCSHAVASQLQTSPTVSASTQQPSYDERYDLDVQREMDPFLNVSFLTGYRRRTRLGFHRQRHTGRNIQCHRFRFMTNIRHNASLLSHLARRHLFHTSPSQHLPLLVWHITDFRMAPFVARCHQCQHPTCLCLMLSGEEVRYTLYRMSMDVIKVNFSISVFLPFLFVLLFFWLVS